MCEDIHDGLLHERSKLRHPTGAVLVVVVHSIAHEQVPVAVNLPAVLEFLEVGVEHVADGAELELGDGEEHRGALLDDCHLPPRPRVELSQQFLAADAAGQLLGQGV